MAHLRLPHCLTSEAEAAVTEADRLTIQSYAAVGDGYDGDIPHLVAKFRYLIDNAHNRHHRTMRALMEGRRLPPERVTEACTLFASLLNAIETPTP